MTYFWYFLYLVFIYILFGMFFLTVQDFSYFSFTLTNKSCLNKKQNLFLLKNMNTAF